ncbi:MAG TPA: S8 family serine peptidase [Gaiellaceae bacterium]
MTRRTWAALAAMLAAFGLAATAVAVASATTATVDWRGKVDQSVLDAVTAGGDVEFFVYLEEKADLGGAASMTSKDAKGRYVYEQLTATARSSQGAVIAELDRAGATHQSFWVTNAIVARGGLAAVEAVASLDAVQHVYEVGAGELERPVPVDPPGGTASTDVSLTVFDSLVRVNADDAWALGFRGQGVVVAGADTGVRWTHEALIGKYRGWDGTTAVHDYNWHDAIHNPDPSNVCGASSPTPCDDDTLLGGGHGTHTVGTIVGSGVDRAGQKNEIGMAPDAQWIACRNMSHGLGAIPTYLECMEWFIAPRKVDGTAPDPAKSPDVVNNSWGCVEVCPPPALQDTLRASRAAGIFYAVSAGNDGGEGPAWICSSIYHPLARYPEAFSVGATTWNTDSIADFSSRGPVLLGDPPDQLLLTKPNITAPGVSIRSALRANDSAYGNLSGTSMAGPHVAGLVALIISADPSLAGNVDRIEDIIEETAVRKTTTELCGGDSSTRIPNNTYGWGRIDALAAVSLADQGRPRPDLQVTSLAASGKGQGAKATISATVSNTGTALAGPSRTEILVDGTKVLALASTDPLAPGTSQTVSVEWKTNHETPGDHVITATADRAGEVDEASETNNSASTTYVVRENKVRNGSFEQDTDANGQPDDWSGQSTGAGSVSYTDGGSDGARSASTAGNGGNAALSGSPSWTSSPIAVTPGAVMDLEVSVLATGTSSPASAGLVYLGPVGEVVGRASLITAPLLTLGFATLEQAATIPAGVTAVQVVLTGFAPTDLATGGTTTFDAVGLFERT